MENNNNTPRIFVHGGMAHVDEILAVALLWLLKPELVGVLPQRVLELPPDFRRGFDWALDIGRELSPRCQIYDHHQDGSPDGECAASLLVKRLDPGFYEYLDRDPRPGTPSGFKTIRLVDTKGPHAFKKEFGLLPGDMIRPYLCETFANPEGMAGVMSFMYGMVSFWFAKYQEDEALTEEAKHTVLMSLTQDAVLIATNKPKILGAVARMLNWGEQDPAITVSWDDRGEGYSLFRRGDNPRVDFTRCTGDDISFAHKGGFILKTRTRVSKERLVELINQAIK